MDGRIIMTAYTECPCSQQASLLQCGCSALIVQNVKQQAIFALAWNNHNILEILCTSTNQRNAANIYLLNDILLAAVGIGNSLLKRLEIHYHKVDFRNLILCHLSQVAFIVTTSKNATKHTGVQRFYPPT